MKIKKGSKSKLFFSYENTLRYHCWRYRELTVHHSWARGYQTFSMLNSAEHEILNAHKYKNIKKFCIFHAHISLQCYLSCSYILKC